MPLRVKARVLPSQLSLVDVYGALWIKTHFMKTMKTKKKKDDDSVVNYNRLFSNEIRSINLLSKDEEIAMMIRIKEGCCVTRDQFIEANLRLVEAVALKYAKRSDDRFMDFVQEGCFGLFKAVDKFDHTLGYRFSTYAVPWIKEKISRYNLNTEKLIREPYNKQIDRKLIERTMQNFRKKHCKEASIDELVEATGLTEQRIMVILCSSFDEISLATPVSSDERITIADIVVDDSQNVERAVEVQEMSEHISDALNQLSSQLTEKHKKVVELRRGLIDGKVWTLKEIAESFGVTTAAIHKMQQKAENCLRNILGSYQDVIA